MNARPTTAAVTRLLERANVPDAERIASFAERAVRLVPRPTSLERLALGASRFGGAPDVPAGFRWPAFHGEPLSFLAQLDLREVADRRLPSRGWLLVFYASLSDAWGHHRKDAPAWRVLWVDAPRRALKRAELPEALQEQWRSFRACSLRLAPATQIPSQGDEFLRSDDPGDATWMRFSDAQERATLRLAGVKDDEPHHHLFGHPQLVQGSMRSECERLHRGLRPSASRSARNELALQRAGNRDWQLLLQLDSDRRLDFQWSDMGRLYFWIRREDLARRAFDRTWMFLSGH